MPIVLSVFLAFGSLLSLGFVLLKIRKKQIQTADAVFWFLLALVFVVLALFPQIAFLLSDFLGIESPANFIFLCALAVLFIKVLLQSVEISKLRTRLSQLTQEVALRHCEGNGSSISGSQHGIERDSLR